MKIVGLTGGIGSGKSTVAKLLLEHGIPVVDADAIAREIVEPGQPALVRLAEAFGKGVLDDDHSLNRAALAAKAFSSEENTRLLNSITHPAIKETVRRRFAELAAAGHDVAVYDMPLLVDQGLHHEMDLTVVVDVDKEERVRRLMNYRGLSEEDARNRMARQVDDAVRREAADVIIDNNGPIDALEPQVTALVEKLRA